SASKITSRGTPFSLATASTTSRSSLLICSLRVRPAGRRLVGLLARISALAGLLPWRQAQRFPVRDQARLVDVVQCHHELGVVQAEGHLAIGHAQDRALQATAAVLRQLQPDLGLLAEEADEV